MIATWYLIIYYLTSHYVYKELEFETQAHCEAAKREMEGLLPKDSYTEYVYVCVEK